MNMIMTKNVIIVIYMMKISLDIVEDLDEEIEKLLNAFGFLLVTLFMLQIKISVYVFKK